MKAAQHTTYNKNNITLNITEIAKPSITDKQVLVKVTAAGVNPLDNMISRGEVKSLHDCQGSKRNSSSFLV